MQQEDFCREVYRLVSQIPIGRVATYGQLAWMAGSPRNARQVGRALRFAPEGLPCHRVVNSAGRTVPGWEEQRRLLTQEGVIFKENGNINLKRSLWRTEAEDF